MTRALWIGIVCLAVAGGVLAASSCLVDRRSNDFTCSSPTDCEAGRTCSGGFCVLSDAPPVMACDTSTCEAAGGVCRTADTCEFTDPPGSVSCPAGIDCEVKCSAAGSCTGTISCGLATSCTVECDGDGSCSGAISCTTSSCNVTCTGTDSCGSSINCGLGRCAIDCIGDGSCGSTLLCGSACACDVTCGGTGACGGTISCPGGAPCTLSPGCDSSGSPSCDRC